MELRHIRYFLVLAEEKSFTKAADRLLMAQPPLSRQIKDLEEELGTALFARSARGVTLTEAGEKFRQYAVQIDHLIKQSEEAIREMKTGLQGTLYLASVEGRAPHIISQWIAGFHKLHPHVEFHLWNGDSDDIFMRLQNELCDLALVVGPYNQEDLQGIRVYEEPWVAMIPANHPLAQDKNGQISLEQLEHCELIIPSRHSRLQEITGWFAKKDIHPNIICRMAHVLNAYELTEQNVGIAIYPAAAAQYTNQEKVIVKKIVNPEVTATYFLTRKSSRKMSSVADEFLKYAIEHLPQ